MSSRAPPPACSRRAGGVSDLCSPLEPRAGLPSVPMSKIVYFLPSSGESVGGSNFRWHDKCLIGMEFPNAEPPLLCSIFHPGFECGPDGRAPSILRGCHGHVTLLPSIPGRALDQNHHQPRPTKNQLNQNQTKTL